MNLWQTVRTHYHWIVAAVAFLMIAVVLGLANNLFSLYLIPVTGELGVSRGTFSMMPSVRAVAAFAANLLLGMVYSRCGFHKPAFAALFLLGGAYLCFGAAHGMSLFFVGAALSGFCEPFCGTAAASRLVSDWFDRYRGTVLGVVLAASGLGASLLAMVESDLISRRGWRAGYVLSAILVVIMAVLVLLIRDNPGKMGLRPLGAGESVRRTKKRDSRFQEWRGPDVSELLHMPYFYVVMVAVFLIGLTTLGIYPITAAHMQDRGLSATFSASMLSLLFLMLAASKVLVGILLDRFGVQAVIAICSCCNVVGILLMAMLKTRWQALAYAAIYPVALAMQTIPIPTLAAELFGRRAFSTTLSFMMAILALSGAAAAMLVNFSYDLQGSYTTILLFLAVMAVLVYVLLRFGFRSAAKLRKKMEQVPLQTGR